MYQSDLQHPDKTLEDKLYQLYNLNRERAIDLGFRPPYLALLKALGNPHLYLPPVIHVAGTNGKGSMIAMLRSILEAQGLRVHVYSSPHLLRFNERIVLAGACVSNDALEVLIDEALALNAAHPVTFFEITTAMAFAAFARVPADIVLLETGLGGRLDCTNVIEAPLASVIGVIGYDHVEYLGDSLLDIAAEKAGIMKAGCPCIIGPQTQEALEAGVLGVFEDRAEALGAALFVHGREWHLDVAQDNGFAWSFGDEDRLIFPPVPLLGAHQARNAATVLSVLSVVREGLGWDISALYDGLSSVHWAGRLELIARGEHFAHLAEDTEIWLDGGHNENAAAALVVQLARWGEASCALPLHLIVGMKGDKDPAFFLGPLLPYCESVILVELEGVGDFVRSEAILHLLLAYPDVLFSSYPTVHKALRHDDGGRKRILICGSLYLAAQLGV